MRLGWAVEPMGGTPKDWFQRKRKKRSVGGRATQCVVGGRNKKKIKKRCCLSHSHTHSRPLAHALSHRHTGATNTAKEIFVRQLMCKTFRGKEEKKESPLVGHHLKLPPFLIPPHPRSLEWRHHYCCASPIQHGFRSMSPRFLAATSDINHSHFQRSSRPRVGGKAAKAA